MVRNGTESANQSRGLINGAIYFLFFDVNFTMSSASSRIDRKINQQLKNEESKARETKDELKVAKEELKAAETKLTTAKADLTAAEAKLAAAESKAEKAKANHDVDMLELVKSQFKSLVEGINTAQESVSLWNKRVVLLQTLLFASSSSSSSTSAG